jgi:hypothetical protein
VIRLMKLDSLEKYLHLDEFWDGATKTIEKKKKLKVRNFFERWGGGHLTFSTPPPFTPTCKHNHRFEILCMHLRKFFYFRAFDI